MRGLVALLFLALLAPTTLAQAEIGIESVVPPERTAAGHAFPLEVVLVNRGEAEVTVYLFAALYEWTDGKAPCGSSQSPAFKRFTHLLQPRLVLAPGERLAYPEEGDVWLQQYRAEDVAPKPRLDELCVFAARTAQGSQIQYEDYRSIRISTRGVNHAPTASFSWSPAAPAATQDVRFEATATDAEGDPLEYAWDFGHHNASGRAQARGDRVTHFFYPPGTYDVTLVVGDGFDAARVVETVAVGPETPGGGTVEPTRAEPRGVPMPAVLTLVGLALAARAARRR